MTKLSDIKCVVCGATAQDRAMHRHRGPDDRKLGPWYCKEHYPHPIHPEVKQVVDAVEGKKP